MIRNWGIRSRVLLLALVPVVCLGIVLGTYLTRVRVQDLQTSEQVLGDMLANQLASASEYGVFSKNLRILRTLAHTLAQEPGVKAIIIADRDNNILIQLAQPPVESHGLLNELSRRIGTETGLANTLTFTRPIFLRSVNNSDPPDFGHISNEKTGLEESKGGHFQVIGKVTVKLSEAHFAERQTQIIVNGGIIMLCCLLLSILLALVIGGSVEIPITRVIEMVSRFSSGDHTARVPERSGGEIGKLESGINHMAADSERSQQELHIQVVQATAELRETMDEMEVKNIELDLARKRALKASRVKSEFLSNMSHEIRTPMNAIVGFANLLAKTRLSKDQRYYIDTVQHSAAILLNLIDDVLGLQSLEAGKSVQPIRFNLLELLDEAIKLLAHEAYAKELELIMHMPADLPRNYMGDAVKISRVIINLLSNAVKFTEHGQIKLSVHSLITREHSVTLNITIKDTGIGIRKEHIKDLFKPFTMFNTKTSRQYSGTGLGLAISRQLMDALGGSLSVSSHPGQGSEFRVELTLDFLDTPLLPPGDGFQERVLVYETHPDMAVATRARLEGLGYSVDMCHSLKKISAKLRSKAKAFPALLLLSLGYPEIRNPEVISALVGKQIRDLPVLILINSLESSVQQRTADVLGGTCLPKCVDTSMLEKKIHQLLPPSSVVGDSKLNKITSLPRPLKGTKILVVEDNRINRHLIALQLRALGANVVQAENGASALTHFTNKRPDAILLDMRLGQETGLDVAGRLITIAGENPVPILMLSATYEEASVERSRAFGVHRWLLKPVDEKLLADSLLEAIASTSQSLPAVDNALEVLESELAMLRPEILGMLKEDLPKQRQTLFASRKQNDSVTLRAIIHTLHGTAAHCKLTILNHLCSTLEATLNENQALGYNLDYSEKLKDELDRIIAVLESPKYAPSYGVRNTKRETAI